MRCGPRRSRTERIAVLRAAPSFTRTFNRAGRAAARPFSEMVRVARLVAARASARAACEGARGPLSAPDCADRRRQDAGGISADLGGIVYTVTLVVFARSLFSPPSAKRWGGVGSGGWLRESSFRNRHRPCRSTPHPRPLPATRCARGGRGEAGRAFPNSRTFGKPGRR
jgi:hypothetical protein